MSLEETIAYALEAGTPPGVGNSDTAKGEGADTPPQ